VLQHLTFSHNTIHGYADHHIGHVKLLDETDATKGIRKILMRKIRMLKKVGFIEHEDDVLSCLLRKWLTVFRERGLDKGVLEPDFVICAPSAYSVSSYHRWYKKFDRAIRAV
jgi:hypothetical protein